MPNHSTPITTIETHSRRVGRGTPRLSATAPRHSEPTRRRPRESDPAVKLSARWRIATNADAQSTSVTPTAVGGSHAGGADFAALGGRVSGAAVTGPA